MNLEYSQFNALDFLVLCMILFSILIGCMRGFVSEVLGLGSWAGAAYLAIEYHSVPESFWSQWISDKMMLSILNYATVGLVSLIVFLTLSQLISYAIKGSIMGPVDRSVGFAFGIVRGCGLLLLFYVVSLFFITPKEHPNLFQTSKSRPILDRGALWAQHFIPSSLREKGRFLESLKEINPQNKQDFSSSQSSSQPSEPTQS